MIKTLKQKMLWERAKRIAEECGHRNNYAYIMTIYKRTSKYTERLETIRFIENINRDMIQNTSTGSSIFSTDDGTSTSNFSNNNRFIRIRGG